MSIILGITLYATNNKINGKNLFSFILTFGILFLLQDYIAARAQLVTFILFVLEILFIECFLDTKKKRYAVGLVLIATLIANLHAAVFYFFFILMMPYIGEYLIIKLRDSNLIYKIRIARLKKKISKPSKKDKEKLEELQAKLVELEEQFIKYKQTSEKREQNPYKVRLVRRDAVKWLILIMVICFAAGLLTPIGDEPYTHIFKLMQGTTTESISEHQPLILAQHDGAIMIIVVLLILLVFTDTKISLKDLFMIGGLLVLTFMARRQFSMLLIIGVMSFTKIICDFTEKYDKNGIEDFTKLVVTWKGYALAIFITLIASFGVYVSKFDDEYISKSSYPVEASDYILEQRDNENLNFNTMKIFNDYNYGSYLLFRGIPVFIDSRADLYSPEFNEGVEIFNDYINVSNIGIYYEDIFKKYEITHVMTYVHSKLNLFLSRDDNYKELYKDDNFVLYERLNVNESVDDEE